MHPFFLGLFLLVLVELPKSDALSFVISRHVSRNDAPTVATKKWGTVSRCSSLVMKDQSSANVFKAGDRVRVVQDVIKGGTNLRGWTGEVTETWEKCDVDPACCCAEFVDRAFSVTVRFHGKIDKSIGRATGEEGFVHYFSEEELEEIRHVDGNQQSSLPSLKSQVPFDGLSCKAFKLEKLQLDKQKRGIAYFEPSPQAKSDDNESF